MNWQHRRLILNKNKNIVYYFARVISNIFIPPTLTLSIFVYSILKLESNNQIITYQIINSFFNGFLFPILMFLILMRMGKIVDHDATLKEERTLPYLLGAAISAIGLIISIVISFNIVLAGMWVCYISNTLFLIVINKNWKISAHATGAAGPLAAMVYVGGINNLIFVFLLILIAWSRVELKKHTPMQVVAGSILGFFSTYFQLSFYEYIF